MTTDLIILTTAITRGEVHKNSLGLFYKYLNSFLGDYKVVHIINVDHPPKLKSQFSQSETIQLLNQIIPDNIKKIIIQNDDNHPSFSKAYKKVISIMKENNYLKDQSIIWWLEDDWKLINEYNFIPLLRTLCNNHNSALNMCVNSPLCSFRAGPIMNGFFFKSYFDISHNTNEFNPEEKVRRNISMNRSISVYKEDFHIICLFILEKTNFPYSMNESCYWHYRRKFNSLNFENNKKIIYTLGCLEYSDSEHFYCKQDVFPEELNIINKEEMYKLNKISIINLDQELTSSLIYITINPPVFQDIGRTFNKKYNIGISK